MPSYATVITVLTLTLSVLSAPIDLASKELKIAPSSRAVKIQNNELKACPIAGEARQTDGSCTPCLAGTYSPLGDSSCTPCRVNMVSALPGASECSACVAPYQARLIGMKHCTLPFFKSKTAPAIKKPSTIVQELVVEEDKRTKQEGRSIKDLSTYLS